MLCPVVCVQIRKFLKEYSMDSNAEIGKARDVKEEMVNLEAAVEAIGGWQAVKCITVVGKNDLLATLG